MLGEWYLPPGKCQAISTITEGIISISHPAPLSSQTRIPQTSSPLVDKSQATQAALLQIRRSEAEVEMESPVLEPSLDENWNGLDLAVALDDRHDHVARHDFTKSQ